MRPVTRSLLRFGSFSTCLAVIIVACGSRTGLLVPEGEPPVDASIDHLADHAVDAPRDVGHDARETGPIQEGGPLDAAPDCVTPPYCDPKQPGFIFQCGVPVFQCSSLEQCEEIGAEESAVAECVNPCLDTLGQNTSNGCEFFAAEMDTDPSVEGSCYAVFLVNQWNTGEPARIEVTRGGVELPVEQFARIPVGTGTNITYAPYDPMAGLGTNQVAVLFLSRDPNAVNDPVPTDPKVLAACPPGVTPALLTDSSLRGTGRGTAFNIKTNVPVVAYQIFPYGGGSARVTSATLLLPTNVWDTNYVAANAYATSPAIDSPTFVAEPTMVIIGQTDNTTVTLKPTAAIQSGGTIIGSPANESVSYMVNRGEYLQFTQPAELTGTAIQSDNPVAVIGGSTLMDVDINKTRADTGHQMLPPVRALGSEYVAVRYRNRRNCCTTEAGVTDEVVPWRIVGVVDGTTLTYDPPQPGAPTTINARQLLEFDAPGPFVVSSQGSDHPFYFAQYMTGGHFLPDPDADEGILNPLNGEGDPEFVNVITPKQYLPQYTFFTDPTYPETNLVMVRARDAATGLMPDVSIDCAGLLSGWQRVGSTGTYEFLRFDLSTGNFEGQNGCNNGVHVITGSLGAAGDAGSGATPMFGVTVWGFGNGITWPTDDTNNNDEANPLFTRWVSYGYPAGANITQLNQVVLSAH